MSTSSMLELQVCTLIPDLCGTGYIARDFMYARNVSIHIYHLVLSPGLLNEFSYEEKAETNNSV